MPVFLRHEATEFTAHGSTFASYVSTSRGSSQLCAWRLSVPANSQGVAHRPTHEEILLVLDGQLRITLDDVTTELKPGAVALVPAGAQLRVDAGPAGASAWVTTTAGLQATTAEGATLTPPWAQ